MKRYDLIEHLYDKSIIDEEMRNTIYSYYEYLDFTEKTQDKFPDVIYV